MGAVWMRVRAEMRARWRAWLALAVMFGVAGGASMAAAAGARRAETAYPRFIEVQRGYDVQLGGIGAETPEEIEAIRRRIAELPQVVDHGFSRFVSLQAELPRLGTIATFPDLVTVADPQGRDGYDISITKPLEGRLADPLAADEAVIDWLAADRLGVMVGDRVIVRLFDFSQDPPSFVPAPVRIVGMVIGPGSMPAVGQATFGILSTTPAFLERHERYLDVSNDAPSVRLRNGAADVAAFVAAVESLPTEVDVVATLPDHLRGVRETLRFEVIGLWLVSAFVALSAFAVLGQALVRETFSAGADVVELSAIGMGRKAVAGVGLVRASAIAVGAAVLSIPVAYLLSHLTPVGLSRLVEPSPGFRFDPLVTLLGAGVLAFAVVAVAAVPSWRASSVDRLRFVSARGSNRIADSIASTSAPVPLVAGVRLALEPGRGARATPVRSAVLGSLIGSVVFVAALTFSASLHHLIQTPELYGFNWDVIGDFGGDEARALIEADPDVDSFGRGGAANVLIGARRLIPYTYQTGVFEPTMLSGRAPRGAFEIALGPKLLDELGASIGGEIVVTFGDDPRAPQGTLTIVGTTVVPAFIFQQVLPGQGAAIPLEAFEHFTPDDIRDGVPFTIRFREGVDIHAKLGALADELGFVFAFSVRQPGSDLISLSRVEGLPIVLAALLGAIAVATLAHALVTSIRRRRRDLALLKTMGSIGRQLRATVRWQASTLTFIAVIIGVPLGVAAGRWLWGAFAGDLGVINAPRSPVLAVAVTLPAALVLANMIAALPARAAARTQPAVVLRSE